MCSSDLIAGNANADNSANGIVLQGLINVTDYVKVGNSTLGEQYLKVTDAGTLTYYGTVVVNVNITTTSGNTTVIANNTTNLATGMQITAGNNALKGLVVDSVTNSTAFVVTTAPTVAVTTDETTVAPRATFQLSFEDKFTLATDFTYLSTNTTTRTFNRYWEFFNYVDVAPGLSSYQIAFGNNSVTNDEMHVVVYDNDGKFTGVPGTVLETYEAVSIATDGKTTDGGGNYYKDVINNRSNYIWATGNDV